MRSLKYRVWDENKGEYCTDYENMVLYPDGTFQIEMGWCIISGGFVVEQYTGLKDKNGKEIYEGDIVEWVNGLGEKHIFEIMWNECRASFQMVEIGQEYPYILQGLSDKMKPYCEVIGSIHENTELLGGEE